VRVIFGIDLLLRDLHNVSVGFKECGVEAKGVKGGTF